MKMNTGKTKVLSAERRFGFVFLLALAACGGPDRNAPLNPSLPGIVVEQLPLGVSLDSVGRDTNGCFFYSQNGAVFVVTDDFGAPICLPSA